ncbi:MAG: HlyC/CorC family transporter [Sulfuriflexus sp.]|nr:HlyC/CorC family transporter [Sulfuriflexus sp.]
MLNDLSLAALFIIFIILILISGFFSGSETSLMTLNRYRLRHLAKDKHRGAIRAQRLLEKPDRLIGLILIGNNAVNIMITLLAAVIMLRLFGELSVIASTIILTVIMVLFAEVTPKTLAALRPERFAFPSTIILAPLMKLAFPLVWLVNQFTNILFKLLKIDVNQSDSLHLTQDELRTVVLESGNLIPRAHQDMLLGILGLDQVSVDDIMVPRGELVGIDIQDDWDTIIDMLQNSQHTRLPVYEGDIDNIIGIVHLRRILKLLHQNNFNKESLLKTVREPYFVPEGTSLNTQLLNFQRAKRRIALVVDEYGELQGLVTLEDILEEIVGEFTTDPAANFREVHPQKDGTWLVDGTANIRELNKLLNWKLPTDGPKTLNGLLLEQLESIPEPGTSLKIAGHPIDILQSSGNVVKTARIYPSLDKDIETGE